MIAWDLETHKIEPGLLAPPVVCSAWFDGIDSELIVKRERMLEHIRGVLKGPEVLAVANGAYDFACIGVEFPELIPWIFLKIRRGEVHDVLIRQALHDVANGHLFKMPNGDSMRLPGGKVEDRYSLELCTYLCLGRTNAKENDSWRLRYGELDGVPLEQWPEEAKVYPIDDVRNTFEIAQYQIDNYPLSSNGGPIACLPSVTHLQFQQRAAFAMHLGAVRGLKIDRELALKLEAEVSALNASSNLRLTELGLIRPDGKVNKAEIKKMIAVNYGSDPQSVCDSCAGTAKVPSEKTGKPINCKKCDCTGLVVAVTVPKTPGEGVCTDRDTLEESEHPILVEYANLSKVKKLHETYVPFLLEGTERPLNVRSNVLVDTGRASYEGLVQLLPREGGVRECIVPRAGYYLCSVDYAAVEMCTLAQVHLEWFGKSSIADTINASGDPGLLHSALGAELGGIELDVFIKNLKTTPAYKILRQMAKAANFGFPGFMGAQKFVISKRKEKSKDLPNGLRLCISSGKKTKCGENMVYEWHHKPIAPTCYDCIIAAGELRESWLLKWPEMAEYFERVKAIADVQDGNGIIDSPRTGYRRGGLNVAAAANHPFQHLAAMGAKNALWLVTEEAYSDSGSPLYGSRPIIFAHDEAIAEVPIARAHEAAYRLAELCIKGMKDFVPDVAVAAEPCLMERWYKAAETVKDENGKLVPWRPKGV